MVESTPIPRIYLDVCCLNRPFDDQRQDRIRLEAEAVFRKHLGIVGMVRFLQQSEMGWGNYTEERYQWLGDPDLEELAKKIQTSHPDRENLT